MKTTFTSLMIASLSLLLPLGITLAAEDPLVASEQDRPEIMASEFSAPSAAITSDFTLLQSIPAEALNPQEMNQIQGKFFRIVLPPFLDGLGDDASLAAIDMQNVLQKEQQSITPRRID